METFTMSRKELPRAGLVQAALAGKVTNREGAAALRLTVRQFQRLRQRGRAGLGAWAAAPPLPPPAAGGARRPGAGAVARPRRGLQRRAPDGEVARGPQSRFRARIGAPRARRPRLARRPSPPPGPASHP